jgi:hypothetical protein
MCRESVAIPAANGVDGFQTSRTILNVLDLMEKDNMVDNKDDATKEGNEENKMNAVIDRENGIIYILFTHDSFK